MKTVCFAVLMLLSSAVLSAQNNPVPLINQPIVPPNAVPGGPAFTLTVSGAGFVANSVVNWNGSPRPTTFVTSSQLTASISATDIASPTSADVTVTNPAPGGGTSNVVQFGINVSTSQPNYIPTSIQSTGNPEIIVDVNNDGNLDVVAIQGSSLLVTLGNGNGTFQTTLTSAIENSPAGLAAGDLNHDGNMDLAIANTNGTASVLIGNGDGTFQPHIEFPTGQSSQNIAIADFDRDGNLDLAVTNDTPNGGVSVLLGLGNGFFQGQVAYPAGPTPFSITVADFNLDGIADIAVGDIGKVSVLLGNGDGTFQRLTSYDFGTTTAYSLAAGDLNQDGFVDLIVGTNDVAPTFRNRGNGTFFAGPIAHLDRASARSLAVGDFNEDGFLDFVAADSESPRSRVLIFLGNGSGTVEKAQIVDLTSSSPWVSAGDFNKDGYSDISVGAAVLFQTTAALAPKTADFGSVFVGKSSKPHRVTLTNYSGAALNISSISLTNDTDFSQTNDCGTSVPAFGTCSITIVFSPTKVGSLSSTLSVTDGTYGSPQSVSLSGTGLQPTEPIVTLNPTSLTFGPQKINTTSKPQNISVSNTGNATLLISSIIAAGDFAQVNTCGTMLLKGQSCTIVVTFTPTAIGTRTGAITLTDNAPDSPQSVPLTGTGTN